MTNIRPFKATYYNPKRIRSLRDVIVPPFDLISEREKKQFLQHSPYNYARIILGADRSGSYLPVHRRLKAWKKNKILVSDEKPLFYFWEQRFKEGKKEKKRYGISGVVSVNDFAKKNILPHEKTHSGPIQDRLKILKATRANLSPVFMMYDGKKGALDRYLLSRCRRPFQQWKDGAGVVSRIWKITDGKDIQHVQRELTKRKFYIIDGHHRFATALAYHKQHNRHSEYVLSVLSDMTSSGVVIYPIFRVLTRQSSFDKSRYLDSLKYWFNIRKSKKLPGVGRHRWWVKLRGDSFFYSLSLKRGMSPYRKMTGAEVTKRLDVSVLQQLIIPKLYKKDIRYVRGVGTKLSEAISDVKKGKTEALWGVSAPTILDLKAVSDHGEVMPQKSTFFFPKISAGALIRLLES